ncbi:MAG: histidine kinase [bacterium]|nr:histidine kinase [bacterium]
MWEKLSLRTRLLLPLGLMFLATLVAGVISLQVFAEGQLREENEPTLRAVGAVALALNDALQTSPDPQATLHAFVQGLGTSHAIRFRPAGGRPETSATETRTLPGRVPAWFVHLLDIPELGASFPVSIEGKPVGMLVFDPDLAADIYEKWIGFLAIAFAGLALMLLTGTIAYLTTGTALAPLQRLGHGLTRMRQGDYGHMIAATGPPELRDSALEANELARTLSQLSHDNRALLRRIVSLQDDERQMMARELHDELGPLLFGIRANAVALLEAIPSNTAGLVSAAEGILKSVANLQLTNHRILDRLRPLYIEELGLVKSIETLLRNVRAQAPGLQLTSQIDARLNAIDGLLSQTVYRVIQEALTNMLRHANASAAHVKATLDHAKVTVEISDDGVGFPADRRFGRGLTGMQERARALSGALDLLREGGRTLVRCRLPAGDSSSAPGSAD